MFWCFEERQREMDAKTQCYWWWFDSHNNARCSPWLQSTLTELNEKTKAMLKLIDEDADSFAQRAEMYYKKRPELISMVENFYRAHRSLAERYDQLRLHPAAHARSPLRHSFPPPKGDFDNALSSIKCFDSFTEVSYNSEDSEIHDPEDGDAQVDLDEPGTESSFQVGASYDELMKLNEELDRLKEENEFQRHLIEQKAKENEELMKQTSDITKLKDEIETLKSQNLNMKEQLKQKEVENIEVKRQFQEAIYASIKLRDEMEAEKRCLKDALAEKDEGKREVIRQLSSAMEMLREENRLLKNLIMKDAPKKQTSPEVENFRGISWRKLFNLSSLRQNTIVPLQM